MSIRTRLLSAAAATGVIFAGISAAGVASAYADGLPGVPSAGLPTPSAGSPLPNTGGIYVQAPGYSQLSPQAGQALDQNGPRPPDVRVPELPGDGMFWHTSYWMNIDHRTHYSIEHA